MASTPVAAAAAAQVEYLPPSSGSCREPSHPAASQVANPELGDYPDVASETEALTRPELAAVLEGFPAVEAAFGYGSGVFRQPGLYPNLRGAGKPMLDFIFAVRSPLAWHRRNLERNQAHYSLLGRLGPTVVTGVADSIGAGVYFNTMVPWRDQHIKYGVVATSAMCSDLEQWGALYCAGRLHKPVAHLLPPPPAVAAAQRRNLDAATAAALLLLPPTFSSADFHRVVCGISYMADIRMAFAEDSRKVDRLVRGSAEGLARMYTAPLARAAARLGSLSSTAADTWAQDDSPAARSRLLAGLPLGLMATLGAKLGLSSAAAGAGPALSIPPQQVAEAALASGHHQRFLRRAIGATVRASSRRQALAGLLSAGPWRSVQYVWQKVSKALR